MPSHEYVGELLLSLNYFPTTQRLTIVILKARNLKIESQSGLWGKFALCLCSNQRLKMHYHSDDQSIQPHQPIIASGNQPIPTQEKNTWQVPSAGKSAASRQVTLNIVITYYVIGWRYVSSLAFRQPLQTLAKRNRVDAIRCVWERQRKNMLRVETVNSKCISLPDKCIFFLQAPPSKCSWCWTKQG